MSDFFKKSFAFAAACLGLLLGNVVGRWILGGL